ncbi:hypothetical protein THMIRHAS_13410 [Thiosulfatimonas sediminis]|uniref:SlyX protein n=1 Tax=Thiosulfatimonas sediminis TaxID=2675054 RepID=A0A6F8PVD5_9GAMM|nr:SlyX family protein [Thiosulfatimonas sediminis]BBP45968.1 hypothetical protein THMIRHAS_13410 [Thiosulfatimonas sediminis]
MNIIHSNADNAELQKQIESLQIVIAHHEIMHQEMEKTVLNLSNRMDDLQNRYAVVVKLMQSMQEQGIRSVDQEVPPPHY